MQTQKVGGLNVGDRIRFNDEDYVVSGVDWLSRHDCAVYLCNEQATDWRLPLNAGDKVEVVSFSKEDDQ
jgi:predicted secreted hydrolase